jgi:hypothetical protein
VWRCYGEAVANERITLDGLDLASKGPEVTVPAEAWGREHRSQEETRRVERRLRMRWLNWWSGVCFRISNRFQRIGDSWEARGDRAYGEWERRAYWREDGTGR